MKLYRSRWNVQDPTVIDFLLIPEQPKNRLDSPRFYQIERICANVCTLRLYRFFDPADKAQGQCFIRIFTELYGSSLAHLFGRNIQ